VSKGQFDPSLERFKGSKLGRSDNIRKTKIFVLHLMRQVLTMGVHEDSHALNHA
jgi:hypothetical protein